MAIQILPIEDQREKTYNFDPGPRINIQIYFHWLDVYEQRSYAPSTTFTGRVYLNLFVVEFLGVRTFWTENFACVYRC